jgi:hypothetical protein|tara:strand:- start:10496 stop:11194 length:699 start_codon:yes stop_codon:yes gene_type:complete
MAGLFSDHGVKDSVNAVAKEKQYEALTRAKAFELERKKVMGEKAIDASLKSGQLQADATKYAGTMKLLGSVVGAATSVIGQTGAYKKWAGNNFGPNKYSDVAGYATDHGISYNQADNILNGAGTTWNTGQSLSSWSPATSSVFSNSMNNSNLVNSVSFYNTDGDYIGHTYPGTDIDAFNTSSFNPSGNYYNFNNSGSFNDYFSNSALSNSYANNNLYNDGGLLIKTNKAFAF